MKLNLSFTLKAATQIDATNWQTWIESKYSAVLEYCIIADTQDAMSVGIFPTPYAVHARVTLDGSQWTAFKTAINDLVDNHADKIFNASFNTCYELEF